MKKAVIIGDGVSNGARSPALWNACFQNFEIEGEMIAVDINSNDGLVNFFTNYLKDDDFIGGAVAAPIKQEVTNYFNENYNTNFTLPTNCFYRDLNNNFVCLNTDILAAVDSIEKNINLNSIKSIAILGDGSVGSSLAEHLKSYQFNKTLYTRKLNRIKIPGYKIRNYDHLFDNFHLYDLVINSTSVGKDGSSSDSILPRSLMRDKAKEDLFVYDVNYINGPNQLLKDCMDLGIKCEDGSNMNIMQAVIAFAHTLDLQDESDKILEIMKKAASNL